MERKTLAIIAVCLIGVLLVSGCTEKSSTEEKAEEIIEEIEDLMEDIEETADAEMNESIDEILNDSVEIEELIEVPWCNASEIDMREQPYVSVRDFRIYKAVYSGDSDFEILFKDEPVSIYFSITIPPAHKVTDLSVEMKAEMNNDVIYSTKIFIEDKPFNVDEPQPVYVTWDITPADTGVLKLTGKISYDIDGLPQTRCAKKEVSVAEEPKIGRISLEINRVTPLINSHISYISKEFNITVSSNDIIEDLPFISGYIFVEDNPGDRHPFEIQKHCALKECNLLGLTSLSEERKELFCNAKAPLYLVVSVEHGGRVSNFYKVLDKSEFLSKTICS